MSGFRCITTAVLMGSVLAVPSVFGEADRDCLLEGTVQKSTESGSERTQVTFHSIGSYDENSRCKIRRDKKMEFKLPDDPRLKDAPDGSEVKYRHRSSTGHQQTELMSIGT